MTGPELIHWRRQLMEGVTEELRGLSTFGPYFEEQAHTMGTSPRPDTRYAFPVCEDESLRPPA